VPQWSFASKRFYDPDGVLKLGSQIYKHIHNLMLNLETPEEIEIVKAKLISYRRDGLISRSKYREYMRDLNRMLKTGYRDII